MNNKSFIRNAFYHISGITLFILLEVAILFFHETHANIWEFVGYYFLEISFFYLSAYLFLQWLKNLIGKIDTRFFLVSLIWIGFFTFIDVLFTKYLYALRQRTLTEQEIKIFIAKLFFRFTYFYSLAFALWSARTVVKREREHRVKDVALLSAENEKAQIEIALLRSQITPHLMLNTLNGVYNLVMSTNSKAAVLVELLMDNLQLSLKGSDPGKVTTLGDEVQLIKNLVRLNAQLGKSNCELNIMLDSEIQNRPFPVNIIATMVENVFKHGDLTDQSHPARITIKNEQSKLKVTLYNKVLPIRHNKKSGIGMKNIEKRLTLLFKDQYELHIAHTAEYYQMDFQIEI